MTQTTTRTAKIPTTVVTGFLGAGKTSLIRHMIENAGGRRLAFIINEFGDLGVDRDLISGCGDESCSADDIVTRTRSEERRGEQEGVRTCRSRWPRTH